MKDYEEYQDRACCRALTADCLACTEGVTVEEYCLRSPDTVGCSGETSFEILNKFKMNGFSLRHLFFRKSLILQNILYM